VLNSLQKAFTFETSFFCEVMALDIKLLVDGKEIDLNEFVKKFLSGTILGGVTALREIKKDWKEIEIKVSR
jgi:hypothetical protein